MSLSVDELVLKLERANGEGAELVGRLVSLRLLIERSSLDPAVREASVATLERLASSLSHSLDLFDDALARLHQVR